MMTRYATRFSHHPLGQQMIVGSCESTSHFYGCRFGRSVHFAAGSQREAAPRHTRGDGHPEANQLFLQNQPNWEHVYDHSIHLLVSAAAAGKKMARSSNSTVRRMNACKNQKEEERRHEIMRAASSAHKSVGGSLGDVPTGVSKCRSKEHTNRCDRGTLPSRWIL